jgi:hypothetical protein
VYNKAMSSNLSGLPPSAIARLNAVADIQAVAVKLIDLPDGLKNNPSPIKLTGTVMGQNPDGSVQVRTDKGVINLMLKDRQGLPQGLKLDIDIPAGRSPQQGSIRQAAENTAPAPASTAPSLASTLAQNSLSSAATAASLKLDRTSSLKANEIEDALRAASPKLADMVAALKTPPAPLQAGQTMRLIPLLPQQGQPQTIAPVQAMTQQALLAALTSMIEQLPAEQQALKSQLVTLLSRMNLSALETPSPNGKSPPALPQNIQGLLQPIVKPQQNSTGQPPQLQIRYEPTQLPSPSKPLDIQVAAFMTTALKPPSIPGQMTAVLPGQIQVQSAPAGQASPLPLPLPPSSVSQPVGTRQVGATSAPTTLPASQPAALPSQILPAQVTGFTRENLPIVSLPNPNGGQPLSYVAQFPAGNLQVGSPLLVSVLPPSTSLQIQGSLPPPMPLASWMQPGIWDSMTDLIQNVQQINPAIAHNLTQIIPQPSQPQNMGGLALFFLSVLRSGDMESWMSPQIANLLRLTGKGEALRAVASDIALTGRSENLTLQQEWRATMFPIYHDQQIHKIPLHYKHQQEDGDDTKVRRTKLMRFLFDLKLARMGNVQIDGFMQPERLDMIIRTKAPLSVPMQRTMQGFYATAMDKSNLHGELTFQFKPEHWVSIDIPVTADEMGVTA